MATAVEVVEAVEVIFGLLLGTVEAVVTLAVLMVLPCLIREVDKCHTITFRHWQYVDCITTPLDVGRGLATSRNRLQNVCISAFGLTAKLWPRETYSRQDIFDPLSLPSPAPGPPAPPDFIKSWSENSN
jgi:hypothetical protein